MPREFEIALQDDNAEDFHLRIDNEVDEDGNAIPHRVDTTGSDRQGKAAQMTVKGRMPTVVHGFEKRGSAVPYTLVIFEWFAHRTTLDKHFREVTIEVSFEAHGKRGQAEPEAQRLRAQNSSSSSSSSKVYWDPEVVGLAPVGTSWHQRSPHGIKESTGVEAGFSAGWAPFLTAEPKYTWNKVDSHTLTSAVQVTGEYAFLGRQARSKANGARFIMLEDASQYAGVPPYLRTAILLKRRPRDNGQFLARVNVGYKVSPLQDLREKLWKIRGTLPVDQPIVFDPRVSTAGSSFDAAELAAVPIDDEFKIASIGSV